jgi:hypothetical protein
MNASLVHRAPGLNYYAAQLALLGNKEGHGLMTMSTAIDFRLPDGWTLRKVATSLAREWLPPFQVEVRPKAPRWVLQCVVETPETGTAPLWEAGISTSDYEARLEQADVSWVIRATFARGRGKGTVLARLSPNGELPGTIRMTVCQTGFPESLFDAVKLEEFLQAQGVEGLEGLFASLLSNEGLHPVAQ